MGIRSEATARFSGEPEKLNATHKTVNTSSDKLKTTQTTYCRLHITQTKYRT